MQYIDNSFRVIGQTKSKAQVLLNADGTPFRWQELRINPRDLSDLKRKRIEELILTRNCKDKNKKEGKKKNKKNKRCAPLYYKYFNMGYSDHLPLVASFSFVGNPKTKASRMKSVRNIRPKFIPSSEADLPQAPVLNTTYDECKAQELVDVNQIDLSDFSNFYRCVKINPKKPIPLMNMGVYKSSYVMIGGSKLGIDMTRSFDPRSHQSNQVRSRLSGNKKMHPMSNMCFARLVLQGEGGKLKYGMGRLGIRNGILTLMVSRREQIKLVELPGKKAKACRP